MKTSNLFQNFKLLFLGLVLLSNLSCDRVKLTELEIVRGNWVIEEIVEEGSDVTHETNMLGIFFQKNGTCEFPFLNSSDLKWRYFNDDKKDRRLILTSAESDFKREYEVVFKVDDRDLLQMELKSENSSVVLTKLLFYPKNHSNFIEELLGN